MTYVMRNEEGDGSSSGMRLRRMIRHVFSEQAKNVYVRVFGFGLFVLGALLTFVPHVFEFFSRHLTDHPEILPVTLLVPYVYFIFEMVLSRLERDEDSTEQVRSFEARLSEFPERRLERKTVVDAFNRSVDGLPNYGKNAGIEALSGWIAECGSTIEVLILAYSSETLLDAAIGAAEQIREKIKKGASAPEMLVFKLLTRDLRAKWRIPCFTIREVDENYRRGLNHRFSQHLERWKVDLFRAFEVISGTRVTVEVRCYSFEPIYKAIIVNGEMGLVGVYDLQDVQSEGASGWDYDGHGARLYEMRAHAPTSRLSQLALRSFTMLFEEIWRNNSRPVSGF